MLNPGDPKAIEKGCKCPSESNQDGQGTFNVAGQPDPGKTFLVEEGCPMHGRATWRDDTSS